MEKINAVRGRVNFAAETRVLAWYVFHHRAPPFRGQHYVIVVNPVTRILTRQFCCELTDVTGRQRGHDGLEQSRSFD